MTPLAPVQPPGPSWRTVRCEAGHELLVFTSLPIGDARCLAPVPAGDVRRLEACCAQLQRP